MTAIIGINAYHGDASAALIVDGVLVAAVEEERFNRIKHWAGFPGESIRYCLEAGGVRPEEVDHVAMSFNPGANLGRRLAYVVGKRPPIRTIVDRIKRQSKTIGLADAFALAVGRERKEIRARFHRVEHHQAHVAAGFLVSPFERAAVLSVDGMGDFTSTLTAIGDGNSWRDLDRVWYPHSLGFLYTAVTMYLGFPHYGDEYKVMGLAPYGEPEFVEVFRNMVRPKGRVFELNQEYFSHERDGVAMTWQGGAPLLKPFHSKQMEDELGPMRQPGEPMTSHHDNIARSLQTVTEEILMHLLRGLYEETKCPNVCMTGGVAMNSVANGKIKRLTPFKEVYVPAGAADNGTSFGAAFFVWNRLLQKQRSFVQKHAYWGYESTPSEASRAVREAGLPSLELEDDDLLDATVNLLVEGKVVGWFQGRMEFGARALGNRSLLADPRRIDMRDIINLRIKFREKFRPFAPSILEEHVGSWFESDEAAPYMEKVLQVREDKRALIPAVTHVDGSGRLQSVSTATNPLYHALISRFFDRTGVPIVLNTSLNENEPIVRTPAEAISCFLRTDMDALVLGNRIIDRHSDGFPAEYRKTDASMRTETTLGAE